MKFFLTGAGGQLGRAFKADIDQRKEHQVVAFTHSQLDITNLAAVERAVAQHKPDAVVNAAAYNFVDKAEEEPEKAMAANKTGPENLAKATAARNIPFLHVSTDYVFDGQSQRPYLESDKPNPLSMYAKSKLAGEAAALVQNSRSVIVRTAWVYHVGGKNFPLAMLSLRDEPEVRVVNDQFGSPTYAPHLARKIIELIEAGPTESIYHMAGLGGASWFDLAQRLFSELGITTPVRAISAKEYPYKAARPRFTVLSTSHNQYQLPRWEQGLVEFVKGLKSEMKV